MGKKHQRHILWTGLLLNEVGDVSEEALEEAFKICERKPQLFSCVNDVLKNVPKKDNKNVRTYSYYVLSRNFSVSLSSTYLN